MRFQMLLTALNVSTFMQAIKTASKPSQSAAMLLRACVYFRLGKFSRALSDCSEVAGHADKRVTSPANQLKGCACL